jgi:hypothetical protein
VEKIYSSHRHVCVSESAPVACVLLGVVAIGKITTQWIILKTITRLVILREVVQLSLQDHTRFKIAPSQLIFLLSFRWVCYASLIFVALCVELFIVFLYYMQSNPNVIQVWAKRLSVTFSSVQPLCGVSPHNG